MRVAISPYVAQGQATYPQARARYLAGLPAGESFYVRTVLREPPDHEEDVFVRVTSIEGSVLTGELNSQIELLRGYHKGQVLKISEKDVQDWLIARPDGTEEGNFVGKFLDNYHPADAGSPVASSPAEKCAVIVQDGAKINLVLLPSLHVATLSAESDPFVLPPDAPQGVKGIDCGREALMPLPYDYRVLVANYPFTVTDWTQDRIGVLEVTHGRLQFRMLKGKMTEPEHGQIESFLDRAQRLFDTEAKRKTQASTE
jgi:hypothetical protein